MIYFDNAATTPLCEPVKEQIKNSLKYYANPSSIYQPGRDEYIKIWSAERKILELLKVDPKKYDIYFTSGATEGNNWVLNWAANNRYKIITSALEHPSVYNTALKIQKKNRFAVSFSKIAMWHDDGRIDASDMLDKIWKNNLFFKNKLVSVMAVNNQLGTIQPLSAIGAICEKTGSIFHVDATQAVGHIGIDIDKSNIDILTASAHKFGGMKGTGFVICKKGIGFSPMIFGGKQNKNMRAGTENVLGITTTATALQDAMENLPEKQIHISKLRDYILFNLPSESYQLNGSIFHRCPGIINLSFYDISGYELALFLEAYGIYVSTNSACESGVEKSNRVLEACGYDEDRINGAIRISLSDKNTLEECQALVRAITEILELKRKGKKN